MPASAKAATAVIVAVLAVFVGVCAVAAQGPAPEEPTLPLVSTDAADAAEVTEPASEEPAPEPELVQAADPRAVADEARSALDWASATEVVNLFDASTGIERTLSADEAPDVEQALAAFADAGFNVGFVVYDFRTQRGLGFNADGLFFSASTIKAPFVSYVVQDVVDGGSASFDEEIYEDVLMEGTGVMASDDQDVYDLRTVIANTIVFSDNTGYALLRERLDAAGFEAWCAEAGVDAAAWQGELYPTYTPRDLAKLWLNTGAYVVGNTPNAAWMGALFSKTQNSFLRAALGESHQVLAKPGYEEGMPGYSTAALNDAGVVLADGDAYVVAIMSDADYDDEHLTDNEHLIVDLAIALGTARDHLLAEREAV